MATPRWLAALTKTLSENPSGNVYQLATIETNNVPQVRSLVHRDIINPKSSPNLPLLVTTTDVRTPKVEQITQNPTVHIAWWIEGSKDQFRVSGTASVVPTTSHPLYPKFDPTKGLALAKLTKDGVDWQAKRKEVFNNMSAHMRASWCRPTPGSVMEGGYEDAKKWPTSVPKLGEAENDEDRKNQEWALSNFALVLIEPSYVDWVQLGVAPNQRTAFTRSGVEWIEQIVVP